MMIVIRTCNTKHQRKRRRPPRLPRGTSTSPYPAAFPGSRTPGLHASAGQAVLSPRWVAGKRNKTPSGQFANSPHLSDGADAPRIAVPQSFVTREGNATGPEVAQTRTSLQVGGSCLIRCSCPWSWHCSGRSRTVLGCLSVQSGPPARLGPPVGVSSPATGRSHVPATHAAVRESSSARTSAFWSCPSSARSAPEPPLYAFSESGPSWASTRAPATATRTLSASTATATGPRSSRLQRRYRGVDSSSTSIMALPSRPLPPGSS
jgi:hypothetical protein